MLETGGFEHGDIQDAAFRRCRSVDQSMDRILQSDWEPIGRDQYQSWPIERPRRRAGSAVGRRHLWQADRPHWRRAGRVARAFPSTVAVDTGGNCSDRRARENAQRGRRREAEAWTACAAPACRNGIGGVGWALDFSSGMVLPDRIELSASNW